MSYDRDMSNKELAELCEAVGAEVEAKNSNKPNKDELRAALDKYYGINEQVIEDKEEVETPDFPQAPQSDTKVQTKAQKRRAQYEENMKLVRVLVTSNASNQTKQDLVNISWGNRLLGYNTDRVILGKPWHVRNGALKNMRNRTISSPVQNEEQNRIDYVTIPAYNVVELGLLSMKEYREMGEKQKAKTASLAVQ